MAAGLGGLQPAYEGIKQVSDVSKLGKVIYLFQASQRRIYV